MPICFKKRIITCGKSDDWPHLTERQKANAKNSHKRIGWKNIQVPNSRCWKKMTRLLPNGCFDAIQLNDARLELLLKRSMSWKRQHGITGASPKFRAWLLLVEEVLL